MRFGSVCSGIEAASQAWCPPPLGWSAQWYAEIDPFCSALLAHRWPATPNLGDFTRISDQVLRERPIDLLVGGTPCQDYSVAGLREGMAGANGQLALEFFQLARRARPTWVVWENVPGVLSSGGGCDFAAILGSLAELGYGWAYRVLDAQYFGVPQRRHRVFVVGRLGDWRPAAAVLFERSCLRGDPPPCHPAGAEVAGPVGSGAPGSGWRNDLERSGAFIVGSLGSAPGGADDNDAQANRLITYAPETAGTVSRSAGHHGHSSPRGDGTDVLIAFGSNRVSGEREVAGAVNAKGGSGRMDFETETFVVRQPIPVDLAQLTSAANRANPQPGDPAPPLAPTGRLTVFNVAPAWGKDESNADSVRPVEIAEALTAEGPSRRTGRGDLVAKNSSVRRLTAVEYERLQGFPDNYTLFPYGTQRLSATETQEFAAYFSRLLGRDVSEGEARMLAKDSRRYAAVGNSIAVPVLRWLGERIALVESHLGPKKRRHPVYDVQAGEEEIDAIRRYAGS